MGRSSPSPAGDASARSRKSSPSCLQGVGPSGIAIVEGRAVASSDVFNDPAIVLSDEVRAAMRRTGAGAVVAVPLRAKGRSIGTLALGDVPGRVFSDAEATLLQAFGDQAALALENARSTSRIAVRSTSCRCSSSCRGPSPASSIGRHLLEAIHTQVGRVLDADNMAIVLRDDERGDLEVVLRTLDGVRDMRSPLRYPSRSVGLMSVVLETGEPVRTDDYAAECARWHVEPVTTFAGVRHWLGVPMRAGDTVIGVLTVRSRERSFVVADERLLTNIAHLAALALRNARLFEERTRAYSELAAAQDQLVRTEKLRALGEMASGVAHDFNNLLASILGRAAAHAPARCKTRSSGGGLAGHRARRARRRADRAAAAGVHAHPPRSALRGGRSQRGRARSPRDHPGALARGDAQPARGRRRRTDLAAERARRWPAIPRSCARR